MENTSPVPEPEPDLTIAEKLPKLPKEFLFLMDQPEESVEEAGI